MAEPMISEDAVDRVLVGGGASVSRQLSAVMQERASGGDLTGYPTGALFEVACRSAFQIGLSIGLRVGTVDRIGGEDLLYAIETYVHHHDEPSIQAERTFARGILEEIHR